MLAPLTIVRPTVQAFASYCLRFYEILYDVSIKSLTIHETCGSFKNGIGTFITPLHFIADFGNNFQSTELKQSFIQCIRIHFITSGKLRVSVQAEGYVRTLSNFLGIESTMRSEWPDGLRKIELALSTTRQKSTSLAPLSYLLNINSYTTAIQAMLNQTQVEDEEVTRD